MSNLYFVRFKRAHRTRLSIFRRDHASFHNPLVPLSQAHSSSKCYAFLLSWVCIFLWKKHFLLRPTSPWNSSGKFFFDNLVIFMAYTKVSRKLSKEDMSDANPYLLGPPPLRPTLQCGLWCEIAGRSPTKVQVAHSHDHFFSDGPVKFRGRQ